MTMKTDWEEMTVQGPDLTFEPFDTVQEEPALPKQMEEKKEEEPEIRLSPQEQKMVDDFASKIDLSNSGMVLRYGAGAQKKIADFPSRH